MTGFVLTHVFRITHGMLRRTLVTKQAQCDADGDDDHIAPGSYEHVAPSPVRDPGLTHLLFPRT